MVPIETMLPDVAGDEVHVITDAKCHTVTRRVNGGVRNYLRDFHFCTEMETSDDWYILPAQYDLRLRSWSIACWPGLPEGILTVQTA